MSVDERQRASLSMSTIIAFGVCVCVYAVLEHKVKIPCQNNGKRNSTLYLECSVVWIIRSVGTNVSLAHTATWNVLSRFPSSHEGVVFYVSLRYNFIFVFCFLLFNWITNFFTFRSFILSVVFASTSSLVQMRPLTSPPLWCHHCRLSY